MTMMKRLDRGFTMVELLVVVSIIVILATMGMTQYRTSVIYSRESVLKEDLFRLRDAIDQYFADKGQYPATLDALVTCGIVRGRRRTHLHGGCRLRHRHRGRGGRVDHRRVLIGGALLRRRRAGGDQRAEATTEAASTFGAHRGAPFRAISRAASR